MKYLQCFEEQSKIPFKYNDTIVKEFETSNWLVVKPETYEDFLYLSKDTEWDIEDYENIHSEIYVNINKKTNDKYLFDFHENTFFDNEYDEVYLQNFFSINKELVEYYGDLFNCENTDPSIIKKDGDYWIIVEDYVDFSDFFIFDRNLRENYVKNILDGTGSEYFQYETKYVELDEYGIKTDDENFIILKVLLLLLEINNKDYDYVVSDIKKYDDIVDIVKEYKINSIKKILKWSICKANERADESMAYDDILEAIYKFFGLENGSAKWENYSNRQMKNNHNSKLWIKFKSKYDASQAKFKILDIDDSYQDIMIDFSTPYNGYGGMGDDKYKNEEFNTILLDEIYESDDINTEELMKFVDKWKEDLKKDISEDEIIDDIKTLKQAENYNI